MIGDTSHDLQMAANAGVHGLGVTYGAHTSKELEGCGPQAVLDSVPGVREWLLPRVSAGAGL
jgi:phosphoglycolate phosphatase